MDLAYAAADCIISRAGASSVSEIQIIGKPCILVPSPNVAEDHQTKNALSLVQANAAILMPQHALSAVSLADEILKFIQQPAQLLAMATQARAQGIADATANVAAICNELTEKK